MWSLPWFCEVRWTLHRRWHRWHSCLSVPPCNPSSAIQCGRSLPFSWSPSCGSLCIDRTAVSGIWGIAGDYKRGLPLIYRSKPVQCPPSWTSAVGSVSAHLSHQTPSQTCVHPAWLFQAKPSGASASWECSPRSRMFRQDLITKPERIVNDQPTSNCHVSNRVLWDILPHVVPFGVGTT